MKFIGRKFELKQLKTVYSSEEYEGILVYGRRRIGKSELIKESYKDESCKIVYFECMKVSEQSNTAAFASVIGNAFRIPTPDFKNFEEALCFLFDYSIENRIILAIDEYPYLREKIEGCDSVFQRVIDTYSSHCHMKLILCGSYIEIMERLIAEDNPLHKRLNIHLNLKQMDYYESAEFYPNFTDEDKVRIYSVFGGIPYYNRFVDDSQSVKDNIVNLIVSHGARFENDPELFLQAEISKMANANETFLAIAKGKSKFADILNDSHVSSSPSLADILKKLLMMDVIKKEFPINDETEKKSYYVISDRLTLFYYKYIFPRKSYLAAMPAEEFYAEFIQEDFETKYVPKEFEEITKQYLLRKNMNGEIKPVLYKIGKYYYDDPAHRRNGEFDVVTFNRCGYDFYEVKFTKNKLDDSVVKEEIRQLADAKVSYHKLGFVSKSGFDVSDPDSYILLSLQEMYL